MVAAVRQGQSLRAVAHDFRVSPATVLHWVRHAKGHDSFYADKDPVVFGRAVVGGVSDAVGYFLTHPGADADSLAESLYVIFAP